MTCKYSQVFGQVGQGVHSIRIFGLAAVDLFLTLFVAISIGLLFDVNILVVFAISMLVAILTHRLFCVDTALNVALFGALPQTPARAAALARKTAGEFPDIRHEPNTQCLIDDGMK